MEGELFNQINRIKMGKWKTLARVATYPVVHPMRTGGALWKGATRTAIGAGAGYVGWEMLSEDKSAARVIGEAVLGEDGTDVVAGTVRGTAELMENGSQQLEAATASLDRASQGMNGISTFLGNVFGGNGGNLFGNFFNNLTSGKVSGLSVVGLIGAAALIFGRTGWFGKIAGGLLAMLLIGNNARGQHQGEQVAAGLPYSRASVYSPENDPSKVFIKAWDGKGAELPAVEMTQQQYRDYLNQKLTPMQIYHQMSSQSQGIQQDQQASLSR